MKEMYKDNRGTWHYGYKGEKLTEVSYSTNSVPKSWCKQMGMYCPMATTNGYCQVTACIHMAEPMPICNDENAIMPYKTPKVNWTVDGYIPVEWIRKWNIDNYPYTALLMSEIIPKMIDDWEKENAKVD